MILLTMFPTINWSRFPQELPVTFGITTLCVLLWLDYTVASFLGHPTGLVTPQLSRPGTLDTGAWFAHFFHASPLHLVSNLLIVLFMGLLLEKPLGPWRYLVLVLLVWQLTVVGLWLFNPYPALGFSGIGLGLMVLAYFYWKDDPQISQMLGILLLINLLFGLMPGVSWHGHLIGALSGLVVYGLIRVAQIRQNK